MLLRLVVREGGGRAGPRRHFAAEREEEMDSRLVGEMRTLLCAMTDRVPRGE